MAVLIAGIAAAEFALIAQQAIAAGDLGTDFLVYRRNGATFLATGQLYEAEQLAGPYVNRLGHSVFYPPTALLLFVPLALLPLPLAAFVWWGVPLTVLAVVLRRLSPAPWAWPLLALLAAWPYSLGAVAYGNSDLWAAAAIGAGFVWGWPAVLLMLKPSLAVFALVGAVTRSGRVSAPVLHEEANDVHDLGVADVSAHALGGRPSQPVVDLAYELGPAVVIPKQSNGANVLRRVEMLVVGDAAHHVVDIDGRAATARVIPALGEVADLLSRCVHGFTLRPSWLAALVLLALASLPFLPLWFDYLTALRNADVRAAFSWGSLPLLMVPVVAWLSSRPANARAPHREAGVRGSRHPEAAQPAG